MLEVRVRREGDDRIQGQVPAQSPKPLGIQRERTLVDKDEEGDGHLDQIDEQSCEKILLPAHPVVWVRPGHSVESILNGVEESVESGWRSGVDLFDEWREISCGQQTCTQDGDDAYELKSIDQGSPNSSGLDSRHEDVTSLLLMCQRFWFLLFSVGPRAFVGLQNDGANGAPDSPDLQYLILEDVPELLDVRRGEEGHNVELARHFVEFFEVVELREFPDYVVHQRRFNEDGNERK